MPQNITDVNTWTSPVVSVSDGDAANGADFLTAPQGLSNRTFYLYTILTSTGVKLIRSAASLAAMTALTGVNNGELVLVQGYGIYSYNSTSAATVDGVFVVSATGMGAGRYIHENQAIANQNPGIAVIGAAGANGNRIPISAVPNGTQFTGQGVLTGTFSPPSGTAWTDVTATTAMATTFASAVAGDIVIIDAMWFYTGSSASTTQMRIAVVDGGSAVPLAETTFNTPTTSQITPWPIVVSTRYTVVNTGSITVKGQFLETTGTANIPSANSLVRAIVVRA